MAEHGFHKLGLWIAFLCARFDRAVVRRAGNAEHTGFFVHDLVHLVGRKPFLLHEDRHDGGVNGAAACAHDDALKRRDAHGGIEAFAVLHSGNGGAVAEMAGHDPGALGLAAQQFDAALADKSVRGPVEAVTADMIFLIVFIGQGVHKRVIRHGGVEAGIEHGDLRYAGHDLFTGFDPHQIRRVMERAEVEAFPDRFLDFLIDKHGAVELFAAVQNAMTDSADLLHGCDHASVSTDERIQHQTDGFAVILHFAVLTLAALFGGAGDGMGELAVFKSDLLANALRKQLFGLHIDQLIFQG